MIISSVHFTDNETFLEICLLSQQTKNFDSFVAVDWHYDSKNKLARTTLVNPLMELSQDVTIEIASKDDLLALQRACDKRFISQFSARFGVLNKPTYKVLTEYGSWSDLRDIWLVRKSKNMARVSVPLLFDIRATADEGVFNVFSTLYVSSSKEFYRFALAKLTAQEVDGMHTELTRIVGEAYA